MARSRCELQPKYHADSASPIDRPVRRRQGTPAVSCVRMRTVLTRRPADESDGERDAAGMGRATREVLPRRADRELDEAVAVEVTRSDRPPEPVPGLRGRARQVRLADEQAARRIGDARRYPETGGPRPRRLQRRGSGPRRAPETTRSAHTADEVARSEDAAERSPDSATPATPEWRAVETGENGIAACRTTPQSSANPRNPSSA